MPKRKTVSVASLVEKLNDLLLNSQDSFKVQREGMTYYVTSVMHETGNYTGFQYLNANDMSKSRDGKSVGIIFDESPESKHQYPDDSRRKYSLPK